MVANVLFADGAAAVVGGRTLTEATLWRRRSERVVPVSRQRKRDDLARRRPRLRHDPIDPRSKPDCRQSPALDGTLARAKPIERYRDVASWAVHPGGPRGPDRRRTSARD